MASAAPWSTRAVFAGAGLLGKLYCNILAKNVVLRNADRLLKAINRPPGRPLITISNHTSAVDDPLVWTAALASARLLGVCLGPESATKRWVLGAEEICFTNRLYQAFFEAGRVIPVRRGEGIHQPAIDRVLHRLSLGDWLHVFVEGKIGLVPNQLLTPIRWGVGRLLLESSPPPLILPVLHLGLDQLVGFGRWVPKRVHMEVRFGPLIDGGLLQQALPGGRLDMARMAVTQYLEDRLQELFVVDNPLTQWNMHKHIN